MRYLLVFGILAAVVAGWNGYVALHADGRIAGRVVRADGRPAVGATVVLFERTLTTLERRAVTETGPGGEFRFSGHRTHHFGLEARQDGVGASPRVLYRLYFRGQGYTLREPLRLAPPG